MSARPHVLILGCGYVGQRLALALRATHEIVGVVRSEASVAKLQSQGITALAVDLDIPAPELKGLTAAQIENAALFYLAPPPPEGLSDSRLDFFLRRLKYRPSVFVYMSTTGVYGDRGGLEVDESTPVDPQTDRAHRRVSAEHMTRIWCHENEVRRIVLRVPGIYGPGRIALARLQRREPFISVDEAGVTNRIHVDDLVAVSIALAAKEDARGVYNVTDGNSISSTAFMRRVAVLAHAPAPLEISREEARHTMSPDRLSFMDESRRVGNRRLLAELGTALRYADIDAGIRASL